MFNHPLFVKFKRIADIASTIQSIVVLILTACMMVYTTYRILEQGGTVGDVGVKYVDALGIPGSDELIALHRAQICHLSPKDPSCLILKEDPCGHS